MYKLKNSFDTDFLFVKLYPEYKKSNIQIVSKIQTQIITQFCYRFICQIVSRIQDPKNRLYPRYRYRLKCSFDTDVLSVKLYPEYKKSKKWIVFKIQIQIQIEIQFDTDIVSVELYPEYKISNMQIVSKIQIQIEIQF